MPGDRGWRHDAGECTACHGNAIEHAQKGAYVDRRAAVQRPGLERLEMLDDASRGGAAAAGQRDDEGAPVARVEVAVARLSRQPRIPETLPVLPLRDVVVFPNIIAPLSVSRATSCGVTITPGPSL